MSASLAGRVVVITRPAHAAQRLVTLIREAGGEPMLCPALEILDAPDPAALDAVIGRLEEYDLAIFISPSAVDKAMARIVARRVLPPTLRCAAIGPGGMRALARFGVSDVIAPSANSARHDSESLLATPFLQAVGGKRVVIFRGDGGRELLGNTLKTRGAQVQAVSCYRRGKPVFDVAPLTAALSRGAVAAVIFTSGEGVDNFCEHLGAAAVAILRDTPVVVPHPRIAAVARERGLSRVVECASGDEALVAAVLDQVHARG